MTIVNSSDAKTIYNNAINSVVTIMIRNANNTYSLGQGFFIDVPLPPFANYTYLLTAAHVVTDFTISSRPLASNIWINTTFPTNTIYKINGTTNRVIGVDKIADIALLRLDGLFPTIKYANSRTECSIGDCVAMIGYPMGFDVQSITKGIIRDNKAVPDSYFSGTGGAFPESVMTDAEVYGGNSGGPLLIEDNSGNFVKWIGVLSWGVGTEASVNGGVSSFLAKQIVDYFVANYTTSVLSYPKGYLGIVTAPLDILLAVARNLNRVEGYLVTSRDTLVAPAKFAIGDIILSINGVLLGQMNNFFPLFTAVHTSPPGTTLTVTYRPANNLNTILTKTVTTVAMPASRDVIFSGYRSLQNNLIAK